MNFLLLGSSSIEYSPLTPFGGGSTPLMPSLALILAA